MNKDFDFDYTMTDFYGFEVSIFGYDEEKAYCEFWNELSNCRDIKEFDNETQAYLWAYKNGYRE